MQLMPVELGLPRAVPTPHESSPAGASASAKLEFSFKVPMDPLANLGDLDKPLRHVTDALTAAAQTSGTLNGAVPQIAFTGVRRVFSPDWITGKVWHFTGDVSVAFSGPKDAAEAATAHFDTSRKNLLSWTPGEGKR